MVSNPSVKTYFLTRKEFAEGYGDHGLCFCARIAKIHPTKVPFLTREPELCKLSIYGGKLNHIHWTGRGPGDKNPQICDWVELTYLNKRDDFFVDKKFLLLKPGLSFFATFGGKGAIHSNLNNKLLGIWGTTKDNKLTIYFSDRGQNAPLVIFDKDGTNNYICRDFKLSII